MKTHLNSVIFGTAIVAASFFLGKAYVERARGSGQIQVTGLGEKLVSDLMFGKDALRLRHSN